MMPVFADTFYFLALLNIKDGSHAKAVAASRSLAPRIVTTAWVLTELADGLADTPGRALFYPLWGRLRSSASNVLVSATDELFERAADLYRARADKEWSLTDCVSFIVMGDMGISEALTADRHFEQAGFVALLK